MARNRGSRDGQTAVAPLPLRFGRDDKARVAIAPCEGFRDGQTAGPSTALRSGRDDNSVAGIKYLPLHPLVAVQEGGVLRVDDA
jgi:hypothetical protein